MVCVCGADRSECPQYGKECPGCAKISGKVYWASNIGKEVCPYFQCVQDMGKENCGECEKIPCKLWYSMKDPSWTDEQHQKSIRDRVEKFRQLKVGKE